MKLLKFIIVDSKYLIHLKKEEKMSGINSSDDGESKKRFQIKSIRTKILLWTLPPLIALLVVFGLWSALTRIGEDTETIFSYNEEIVKAKAAELGELLLGFINEAQTYSEKRIVRSLDWETMKPDLISQVNDRKDRYTHFLFGLKDGTYWTTTGTKGSIADREYFQQVVEQGKKYFISNPLISRALGIPVFILAYAVYDSSGKTAGMFGSSISLEALSSRMSDIQVGENGFGFMTDSTGLIMAHPKTEYIMNLNLKDSEKDGFKGFDSLGKDFSEKKSGRGSFVNTEGRKMLTVFEKIPNSPGWTLSIAIDELDVLQQTRQSSIIFFAVMIVVVLIVALILFFITKGITRPIVLAALFAEKFAENDFTQEVPQAFLGRKDEIGRMAHAFVAFSDSINSSIGSLRSFSEKMKQSSKDLASISDESGKSVENISKEADKINREVQNTSASVEEVTSGVEEVAASAQAVSKTAEELSENSENTSQAVDSPDTNPTGARTPMTGIAPEHRYRGHPAHPSPVERHDRPVIIHVTVTVTNRRHILANRASHEAIIHAWQTATYWLAGNYVIMPEHVHLFCAPGSHGLTSLKHWGGYWKRLAGDAEESLKGVFLEDCRDTQMRSAEHDLSACTKPQLAGTLALHRAPR